ncbi:MAG: adenylylsulfate kinase [Myxococcales bacterium]|nr:adenylylsulfate kinase [Myxococcales bacterium]
MSTGVVVWFTGLPASGKSTLAERVRDRISPGRGCVLLDGDAVRDLLGADRYDPTDRDELYRVLRELAALIAEQHQVVLVAATAPLRMHRDLARAIAPAFLEVWVRTPLEECEQRDTKGLYARARAGDAPMLPGVGAPYESPLAPDIVADGGLDEEAVGIISRRIQTARAPRGTRGRPSSRDRRARHRQTGDRSSS